MKKLMAMIVTAALLLTLTACGQTQNTTDTTDTTSEGDDTAAVTEESVDQTDTGAADQEKAYKVGFSNSYNGNTFRQALEESFKKHADLLKEEGRISDYTMAVSNNDNTQQIAQIQSMILDGCEILVIDPGSTTALNDVIDDAVAQGIIVFVVSDGPIETDTCYQFNTDAYGMMRNAAENIAKLVNKEPEDTKVLYVRGIMGLEVEEQFFKGQFDYITGELGMQDVGQVEGQWTDSVAKEALEQVLPSLNYDVDLIMGQGGDDLVAAELFEANGHEVPLILGSCRGGFLKWWANACKTSGYETYSSTADPWVAAAALYMAIDIADGKISISDREMYGPGVELTQETMEANLEEFLNMPADKVYYEDHDYQWIVDTIYSVYAD